MNAETREVPAWRDRPQIRTAFWAVVIAIAVLFGAMQAWSSRNAMNHDGIQYLDNATEYALHDWKNAANTQWSPLYAWIIAVVFGVLHPSPQNEFAVTHFVNFLIYLGALGTFTWFLRNLLLFAWQKTEGAFALVVLAMATFVYCSVGVTTVAYVTPDLLLNLFVFAAAAMLLRVQNTDAGWGTYLLLGLILGFGYLAKAPFLFYAVFIFLISLFCSSKSWASRISHVSASVIAFLVIAAPYIYFLSTEKGRITYGDSGRYNVAWMVNGVPYYHWQGSPGHGRPFHPTRQISDNPPIYEFATPVAGTYPPWYDPIYWNEGVEPHYRPLEIVAAIRRAVTEYASMLVHDQLILLCGLVILACFASRTAPWYGMFERVCPVALFVAIPFGMYALVHAEPRFFGAFLAIFWTTAYCVFGKGIQPPIKIASVVMLVVAGVLLLESSRAAGARLSFSSLQGEHSGDNIALNYWDLAKDLQQLGIQRGQKVAIVGRDLPYFWARLLGVQVVAEVLPKDRPCCGAGMPDSEWETIRQKLATTSAQWIVSPCTRGLTDQRGWTRAASAPVAVYALAR